MVSIWVGLSLLCKKQLKATDTHARAKKQLKATAFTHAQTLANGVDGGWRWIDEQPGL